MKCFQNINLKVIYLFNKVSKNHIVPIGAKFNHLCGSLKCYCKKYIRH